jgi:hypothetical protein
MIPTSTWSPENTQKKAARTFPFYLCQSKRRWGNWRISNLFLLHQFSFPLPTLPPMKYWIFNLRWSWAASGNSNQHRWSQGERNFSSLIKLMIICADLNLGRRVMRRKFVTIALRHEAFYRKSFFSDRKVFFSPRTTFFFGVEVYSRRKSIVYFFELRQTFRL